MFVSSPVDDSKIENAIYININIYEVAKCQPGFAWKAHKMRIFLNTDDTGTANSISHTHLSSEWYN